MEPALSRQGRGPAGSIFYQRPVDLETGKIKKARGWIRRAEAEGGKGEREGWSGQNGGRDYWGVTTVVETAASSSSGVRGSSSIVLTFT